jgi:intein-encoded DNA endonuclease-like protein
MLIIFIIKKNMSYYYNLNFFDKINEESSYFIGLLFADGSINNKGRVTLNLSEKDVELIQIFKKKLKTNKPIFSVKKTNSSSFSFQNKIISEQLNNFGLIPNKSLILKFSEKIPNEFLKDYIRGYFDGDGCVSIKKGKNTSSLRVHFVGTYEMLHGIQNVLINELNITKTKINQLTKDKNTFQFEIRRKNDIQLFKDFIYYDNCICLSRKKEKFFTQLELKHDDTLLTSRHKNICYRKKRDRWRGTFYIDGVRKEKSFKTESEALNFLNNIKP